LAHTSISTYFRPNIHQNGLEILGVKKPVYFIHEIHPLRFLPHNLNIARRARLLYFLGIWSYVTRSTAIRVPWAVIPIIRLLIIIRLSSVKEFNGVCVGCARGIVRSNLPAETGNMSDFSTIETGRRWFHSPQESSVWETSSLVTFEAATTVSTL
jgi:hypothetical protein